MILREKRTRSGFALAWLVGVISCAQVPSSDPMEVEGQPLGANVHRLLETLEFLGTPLPQEKAAALRDAERARDARRLQELLDPHVVLEVHLSSTVNVHARRNPREVVLQQGGYTPVIVKVINPQGVTPALRISSPQAGTVYTSPEWGYFDRLKLAAAKGDPGRFLDVEMFTAPPLTPRLSGLHVEYVLALIYSRDSGLREAGIRCDVGPGQGGETTLRFNVRPGVEVKLSVKDHDGKPTAGSFTFLDKFNHVHPPQAKRLAPDFFFQRQIYRPDGGTVLLPPGEFTMTCGRGPEYKLLERKVTIPDRAAAEIHVPLERWVNPGDWGFYSGDHHIHAAGCAHYTRPTDGFSPSDMFLHVKGEGLNVGCALTWGPCFESHRRFLEPVPNALSEPFTLLKYDLEISGFGSQALGHVCLLNLKNPAYPGSSGIEAWPTWTTPILGWARSQGAVTGYAHSGYGLHVLPQAAAKRLLSECDTDKDGKLNPDEAARRLLPEDFAAIDADGDKNLTEVELTRSIARVAHQLPNLAIPEMDGIGAQEIVVTAAHGLCDFISAMDTKRVREWNCWYHLLNCGFPIKVSGETDFPCISGNRVGQGRVYVQLGKVDRVDFGAWCEALARGRSYISDGYAHALEFAVDGKAPGEELRLDEAGTVAVRAKVAIAAAAPLGTSEGAEAPSGEKRRVELVVNGRAVDSKEVPADDQVHELRFATKIERSSWVALRQFPQMHTNPVDVIVAGKPLRVSRKSALWCAAAVEQLWRMRRDAIATHERPEADKTFKAAIERYRRIATEAPE